MKIKLVLVILPLLLNIFRSCYQGPVEPAEQIYYFNSFETEKDTIDWQGISYDAFVKEPVPNGGKKSLLIGGGCIQPTASIDLPVIYDNSEFILSCWCKINEDNQSGSLLLIVMEGEERKQSVEINVVDKIWNLYKSDKLICQSGEYLRIEIMIGGIVPASMNLDLLKIEKIDKN